MRISDWSSDVCSSDLDRLLGYREGLGEAADGDEAAALQQAEDALMPRRDAVPGVAGAGAAAARISCQRHDWPPAFFLPVQEWPLPFSFGSLPAMPYSASRRSISFQIPAGRMPISDSRPIQLDRKSVGAVERGS